MSNEQLAISNDSQPRKMKYSGVEWIGDIPEEWEVRKIKHYYNLQSGFTPDTKNETYYDDENGYDWVNISDIVDGKTILTTKRKISRLFIEKYSPTIIPKGSLLYSFKLSVGQTAFAGKALYSNEAIASFLPNQSVNLRFLRYSSILIKENAEINIYGARILNRERINNAFVVFPPLSEQQAIADILDRKCTQIDALIANEEQQIAKLKAYKQSVITETVTKGLDPDVPMKDSGVEWIGEIPAEWSIIKFKFLHKGLNTGEAIGKEYWTEEETDMFFYTAGLVPIRTNYKDFPIWKYTGENDLLMARNGTPYVYFPVSDACYTDHIIRASMKADINRKYVYYSLSQSILSVVANTVSIATWSASLWNEQIIPFPSEKEQQAIADILDRKCSQIDRLIAIKQHKIEKIQKYKKSLIYEYVTGKKEVI